MLRILVKAAVSSFLGSACFTVALFLSLFALSLGGCGYRSSSLLDGDSAVDAGPSRVDGTVDPPDNDAGESDSGGAGDARVESPDALPTSVVRSLRCDFDEATVLRAAARFAACSATGEGADPTLRQVVELWEAGLFSGLVGGSVTSLPINFGCDVWRCIADSVSCGDVIDCRSSVPRCDTVGRRSCDGSLLQSCRTVGGVAAYVLPRMDCGAFGARCEDAGDGAAACVREGCRIGDSPYPAISCVDGDLAFCEGGVLASCESVSPSASCAHFAIEGEWSLGFCHSGEGTSVGGGYRTPIECTGEVAHFTSISGVYYELDCLAAGYYRGCAETGCLE